MRNEQLKREKDLFAELAPFWEYFEHDGLTDVIIVPYKEYLLGRVLVVGSGQGLVSDCLIKMGFDVISIDSVPEMARRAKERRGVETQVVDFMNYHSPVPFDTIIVNTGVITPSSVDKQSSSLAESLFKNLAENGRVILSFFERTSFDDLVQYLSLDISTNLIAHLMREIESGKDIFTAFESSEVNDRLSPYTAQRYRVELLEYGEQIRATTQAYRQGNFAIPAEQYIPSALTYISYGLSFTRQSHVVNAMSKVGFHVETVNKHDHTIVTVLTKEASYDEDVF